MSSTSHIYIMHNHCHPGSPRGWSAGRAGSAASGSDSYTNPPSHGAAHRVRTPPSRHTTRTQSDLHLCEICIRKRSVYICECVFVCVYERGNDCAVCSTTSETHFNHLFGECWAGWVVWGRLSGARNLGTRSMPCVPGWSNIYLLAANTRLLGHVCCTISYMLSEARRGGSVQLYNTVVCG